MTLLVGGVVACGGELTPPPMAKISPLVVVQVAPRAGAVGVDPAAPVVVRFSHPMMTGSESRLALHAGTIGGPSITGEFSWSADGMQLTFVPSEPLDHATTYVLHLSPTLTDAFGRRLDFGACARGVGGQPAASGPMPGGMMGGGGQGTAWSWQPGNGAWGYGMAFTFTTA